MASASEAEKAREAAREKVMSNMIMEAKHKVHVSSCDDVVFGYPELTKALLFVCREFRPRGFVVCLFVCREFRSVCLASSYAGGYII